jgi:DNA polymerase-4
VKLKVKYADFQQITRSRSVTGVVADQGTLERISSELLAALFPVQKGIRLLGITLSALAPADMKDVEQLPLGI